MHMLHSEEAASQRCSQPQQVQQHQPELRLPGPTNTPGFLTLQPQQHTHSSNPSRCMVSRDVLERSP